MDRTRNLIPVLLGGDLNAYSVALSFKHSFNINSHVFTRYKCGATERSRFITTHLCSGICDSNVALPELLSFASKHLGSRLLLIPCSDSYLELLYEIRDAIEGIYQIFIPKEEHYFTLTNKAKFYQVLKSHKIPTPESYVITKDKLDLISGADVTYPAVLKPSRSAEYYACSFKGKKKVYFVKSKREAMQTAKKIFAAGYENELILQEKISPRAHSYVLTTLSNSEGTVVRAALAKVLMLERSDTGYGNYSALLTTPLDSTSLALINMLNKISYRGIANFDIMRDGSDSYCLEMNARQGRSCDYLRGAGISIARHYFENAVLGESVSADFPFEELFWHYPSSSIVMKNLEDEWERSRLESLIRQGRDFSPFDNQYEGVMKKLYGVVHDLRLSVRLNRQRRASNETF